MPDELEQLRERVAQLAQDSAALARRVAALEQAAGSSFRLATSTPERAAPQVRLGLVTVNRVGAVTLALGILFFLKYAADNHWIGPLGRLFIGLLAGAGFLLYADRLRRQASFVLGQGIALCGLGALYATALAAGPYYKILLSSASMALMLAVCALAILLEGVFRSNALSISGFAGVLLTLVLMRGVLSPSLHAPYVVGAEVAAIAFAIRRSLVPLVISQGFAALITALIMDLGGWNFVALAAVLAAIHWLGALFSSQTRLKVTLYLAGHALTLLAALEAINLLYGRDVSQRLTVASVALALYGTTLLAYGVFRQSDLNRYLGLALLGLVVLKLYVVDIWFLSYGARITAFVLLGLVLLGASFIYNRYRRSGG